VGASPTLVVSFERRGIMAHYAASIARIHQVADEAVNDLGRIKAEDRRCRVVEPGGVP
jgi:hypothetical protein